MDAGRARRCVVLQQRRAQRALQLLHRVVQISCLPSYLFLLIVLPLFIVGLFIHFSRSRTSCFIILDIAMRILFDCGSRIDVGQSRPLDIAEGCDDDSEPSSSSYTLVLTSNGTHGVMAAGLPQGAHVWQCIRLVPRHQMQRQRCAVYVHVLIFSLTCRRRSVGHW